MNNLALYLAGLFIREAKNIYIGSLEITLILYVFKGLRVNIEIAGKEFFIKVRIYLSHSYNI